MKTLKLAVLAVVVIASASGCSSMPDSYKKQVWTPAGFNYTLSRDRTTGQQADYFGLSWDLK